MELNIKLIEDGEKWKKVVLWKDGRNNALDLRVIKLWTTETKSL